MHFFAARFDGGFEGAKKRVVVKSCGPNAGTAVAADKAAPEKPRLDYVFIMGKDSARAKKLTPVTLAAEVRRVRTRLHGCHSRRRRGG